MFTETFQNTVINEFNKRATFSALRPEDLQQQLQEQEIKQYKNWLQRMPFVIAYSNLRYEDESLEETMNHSVLTTANFGSIADVTTTKSFYDYYQVQPLESGIQFGVHPKPMIKSLDVTGRGKNGTLKQVKLTIECYNFQQFLNVRRYFAVPCTSIFLQFGNFVNENEFRQHLYPPIEIVYNNPQGNIEETYLNQNHWSEKYEDAVHMDALHGIVYGFDVDQDVNTYTLTVNLITKGLSQIFNYMPTQFALKEQQQTFGNSLASDLTRIVNNNEEFKQQKQVAFLTDAKEPYVTFNWIVNVVILGIRNHMYTSFIKEGQNLNMFPALAKNMFVFKPEQKMIDQFYSNTKDVILLNSINNKNNIGNNFKVKVQDVQEKLDFYRNVVYKVLEITEPTDQQYNGYGSYKPYFDGLKNPNQKFGWTGNIYIRFQKLLQILKTQQQLTINYLLTQIIKLIKSAFNFSIGVSYLHKKELFLIEQYSLNYVAEKHPYKVPNLYYNSIVKSISSNFSMPDNYKITILQAYGGDGGLLNQLFKGMFKGGKPRDIQLHQGLPNSMTEVTQQDEQETQEKNNKKIEQYDSKIKSIYDANGILIVKQIQKSEMAKTISSYNRLVLMRQQNEIVKENGIRSVSSIYKIQIELTFDFIANIAWGQLFQLNINPLGWFSRFYVIQVQYRINESGAETIIKGMILV